MVSRLGFDSAPHSSMFSPPPTSDTFLLKSLATMMLPSWLAIACELPTELTASYGSATGSLFLVWVRYIRDGGKVLVNFTSNCCILHSNLPLLIHHVACRLSSCVTYLVVSGQGLIPLHYYYVIILVHTMLAAG